MASATRPLPAEIYRSGTKLWESAMYVQDDRKTSDWNTRHAYLAKYGRKVFLLLYVTRPPNGKVKECWILHRVAEGLAPWGFSKEGEYSKIDEELCLGVQTKDPEGLKFVLLSKVPDVSEFTKCVNKALGRDRKPPNTRAPVARDSRPATVPTVRSRDIQDLHRRRANTVGAAQPRQPYTDLDLSSLRHMREGSSSASSVIGQSDDHENPEYQGGENVDENNETYEQVS